jgi:hypothetical protein
MKRRIPYLLKLALFALPGLLAFLLRRFLAGSPSFTETWVSRRIFTWISHGISFLTGLLPFSLTEVVLVLAIPLGAVLLVRLVVHLIRSKGKRRAILSSVSLVLVLVLSLGYAGFLLLHGYNYLREPFAASSGLVVRDRSTAELEKITEKLLVACIEARSQCAQDADGVLLLPEGRAASLAGTWKGFAAVEAEFPTLTGPWVRPKPVLLSHAWSYTGIVGMYFPFFVEANVNVDVPDFTIPASAAHEAAHAIGFAREDEANFISVLACTRHPDVEVRYSGFQLAFSSCYSALAGRDDEAAARVAKLFPDSMRRDYAAAGAYWKQFEGPVREVSTQTNDAYLKANDQKDGVYSYGRMVDLVLAYYGS